MTMRKDPIISDLEQRALERYGRPLDQLTAQETIDLCLLPALTLEEFDTLFPAPPKT